MAFKTMPAGGGVANLFQIYFGNGGTYQPHLPLDTYDGGVVMFEADITAASNDFNETIATNPNGISLIGAYAFNSIGSNYFFNGLIDDVRIYDRALSAEEVQALYNLGQ